jgi:acyl-CoA synthetase (AMP-forming)/AMP-acid ligase II
MSPFPTSDRVKEMIISGGENVYSSTHTSFLMNPKPLTQNARICRKLYGTDAWAMITGNGSGRAAR